MHSCSSRQTDRLRARKIIHVWPMNTYTYTYMYIYMYTECCLFTHQIVHRTYMYMYIQATTSQFGCATNINICTCSCTCTCSYILHHRTCRRRTSSRKSRPKPRTRKSTKQHKPASADISTQETTTPGACTYNVNTCT